MADTTTRSLAATFAWANRASIPIKAEVAATEIQRIQRSIGAVTPEAVVSAASEADSPLHAAFTWENDEAARRYREVQARYLLRSLVVIYTQADGEPLPPQRYLVKLRSEQGDRLADLDEEETLAIEPHVYLPVTRVMDHLTLRKRYLKQALNELNAWHLRYAHLREFDDLFHHIGRVIASPPPPAPPDPPRPT